MRNFLRIVTRRSQRPCTSPLCMILCSASFFLLSMLLTGVTFQPKLIGAKKGFYVAMLSATANKSIHPAFHLIKNFEVTEYGFRGQQYIHKKSGAEVQLLVGDTLHYFFLSSK